MIYLDSCVVLAELLSESRHPPAEFWNQTLITSRLTHYEVWNRLHAYHARPAVLEGAAELLARMEVMELTPQNLARALAPFPVAVRTQDGLQLASAVALQARKEAVAFATYDRRLARAAAALDLPLFPI